MGENCWMVCRKEVMAAIQVSDEGSMEVDGEESGRAVRWLALLNGAGLGTMARLGTGTALEFPAWVVE